MVNAALAGDFKSANKINSSLLEAYDLLFAENNPAGVKYFMHTMNLLENNLRLPLVPLSENVQKKIDQFLSKSNV
jgi:4-hydroxy-tetrahydrodipicolinate synthase